MKNTSNIALILCILIIGFLTYDHFSGTRKKIGVIQMNELVYEYKGMKEATAKYGAKIEKWNTQNDSLEQSLKKLIQDIRMDSINKDMTKLKQDQQLFLIKRQSFLEYRDKLTNAAQEEDTKTTAGVMAQLNEQIKAYAVQEGYDVILCNTQMNNVGYAAEAIDITKNVLEFANKKYNGE
jgi:Skp family chaperone for outer membrane proteins